MVSVVIVTYGAWDWTKRCLDALRLHTPQPHEVVVVDNASPDRTAWRIRWRYRHVRLARNRENVGFGPATNQGARIATGGTLVLLNSDAIVQSGWLAPLLDELDKPDVGAAGPMLLHPDGKLQLAGAQMHPDGTVTCIGDGGNPDDYKTPATVDFSAAACLAIRRDVFLGMGGFDDIYAPAYYEDADLCFRLAAKGLKTRYVPSSVVVHKRFASSSLDQAIDLSARNRAIFLARWGHALQEPAGDIS